MRWVIVMALVLLLTGCASSHTAVSAPSPVSTSAAFGTNGCLQGYATTGNGGCIPPQPQSSLPGCSQINSTLNDVFSNAGFVSMYAVVGNMAQLPSGWASGYRSIPGISADLLAAIAELPGTVSILANIAPDDWPNPPAPGAVALLESAFNTIDSICRASGTWWGSHLSIAENNPV